MKQIKIGVEIECLVNDNIFTIHKGDYHHGRSVPNLPGWKAENDSSLHRESVEDWDGEDVEFVSNTVSSKNAFFKQLKTFEDYFSKRGELQLSEALKFNKTCGAHVHFSIKDIRFKHKTIWKIFRETRNLFLKLVSESDIQSRNEIKKQYYRQYAKKCSRQNYLFGRAKEFNFESENSEKGLEWRSINLKDIKTWKDFYKLWEIVWSCLQFLEENSQKYKEERTITLKSEKDKIKGLEDTELEFKKQDYNEFKSEEIMLRSSKLFSREGEPPESEDMVKLRLKFLKDIEPVTTNIESPISVGEILWAKNELNRQNILVNNELDLIFKNPDGTYNVFDDELEETITIGLGAAVLMGYSAPTTQITKRLLILNKITVSSSAGNYMLGFNLNEGLEGIEYVV